MILVIFGVPFPPPWRPQWALKSTQNQHEIDVEDMHVSRPHFEGHMEPFWGHFGGVFRSSCYASTAHTEFAENLKKTTMVFVVFLHVDQMEIWLQNR